MLPTAGCGPGLLEEGVELLCETVLRAAEQMPVDIHGHADLGVTHALADHLRMGAELDQQRGVTVADGRTDGTSGAPRRPGLG
jgi:hypothetical protein